MYKRICKNPQCKRVFFTNIKNKQYCSKECSIESRENRNGFRLDSGNGQMCWRCTNACGKCSWSGLGIPVSGWKAKKTEVKHRGEIEFFSYRILFCPLYNQDVEIRTRK